MLTICLICIKDTRGNNILQVTKYLIIIMKLNYFGFKYKLTARISNIWFTIKFLFKNIIYVLSNKKK
jgi:hypothetical protein